MTVTLKDIIPAIKEAGFAKISELVKSLAAPFMQDLSPSEAEDKAREVSDKLLEEMQPIEKDIAQAVEQDKLEGIDAIREEARKAMEGIEGKISESKGIGSPHQTPPMQQDKDKDKGPGKG